MADDWWLAWTAAGKEPEPLPSPTLGPLFSTVVVTLVTLALATASYLVAWNGRRRRHEDAQEWYCERVESAAFLRSADAVTVLLEGAAASVFQGLPREAREPTRLRWSLAARWGLALHLLRAASSSGRYVGRALRELVGLVVPSDALTWRGTWDGVGEVRGCVVLRRLALRCVGPVESCARPAPFSLLELALPTHLSPLTPA